MHHFLSTTGVGLETVDVTYEADDDTVYGVEIKWQGKEISGLLSEEVNADIELECYADQRKRVAAEIVNHNLDVGQKLHDDRFINRGVKGEFYPCKPEIFELTYEPAPLAQPVQPAPQAVNAELLEALEWAKYLAYTSDKSCQDAKWPIDKALDTVRGKRVAQVQPDSIKPTYYVCHPGGTYSEANPQPVQPAPKATS